MKLGKPAVLFALFWGIAVIFYPGSGWTKTSVNHDSYAALLKTHVQEGVVDYKGLKSNEVKLDRYLDVLATVDSTKLSRNERFAFFINAYNAWTLKLILMGYPGIESIKDMGSIFKSPWKKKFTRIDGKVVSLDHIEHEILRPTFQDPRVHFAINCAAFSCPPLQSEPYRSGMLDDQLNNAAREFINNPERNYLDGNVLYVSRIFKWFGEDFNDDIIGFFMKFARAGFKEKLEKQKGRIKVKYLSYDWSLNGR